MVASSRDGDVTVGKTTDDDRIMMRNPNTGRDDVRIKRAIFEPVRDAILETLDEFGEVRASDLAEEVGRRTDDELWADASTIWFTTTVKLHLEATGLVERRGSPQIINLTDQGREAVGR